jgi:hypothetical protein
VGKRKDREIIREAAASWRNEIDQYIVPGVQTKGERKGYARQSARIGAALSREAARRKAKEARRGSGE